MTQQVTVHTSKARDLFEQKQEVLLDSLLASVSPMAAVLLNL